MLPVCQHVLLLLFSTVPTAAVAPQQVVTGSTNSPSVVKQVQEQENRATDSPSQNSKPEQQDDKDGEVKKEKKKVKKPKEKVLWSENCNFCDIIFFFIICCETLKVILVNWRHTNIKTWQFRKLQAVPFKQFADDKLKEYSSK